MSSSTTRRSVLAGMGSAAAYGAFAASMISAAHAAQADAQGDSAVCLSMIYLNAAKAKFDARKYEQDHLPLLKRIYGDSVERIELRIPPKPVQGMPPMPAPVLAAINIWIRDIPAFGSRTAASAEEVSKDLQTVTSRQPIVQYDKVIALLGEARDAMTKSTPCFSTFFPAKEGAQWNAKYYTDVVVPKMVTVYGAKAIRRIEVCQGSASGQGGAKPALLASSHLYIKDMGAFYGAMQKAMTELGPEGPNYTNIFPTVATLNVEAAG